MGISGVRTLIRSVVCAGALAMTMTLGACTTLSNAPSTGAFVERTVTVDGTAYRYQVFVPAARHRHGAAPTVLFLHGTGERGSDGDKPTRAGVGPYLRAHADVFPGIIVFPQAPDDSDWKGVAAQSHSPRSTPPPMNSAATASALISPASRWAATAPGSSH